MGFFFLFSKLKKIVFTSFNSRLKKKKISKKGVDQFSLWIISGFFKRSTHLSQILFLNDLIIKHQKISPSGLFIIKFLLFFKFLSFSSKPIFSPPLALFHSNQSIYFISNGRSTPKRRRKFIKLVKFIKISYHSCGYWPY